MKIFFDNSMSSFSLSLNFTRVHSLSVPKSLFKPIFELLYLSFFPKKDLLPARVLSLEDQKDKFPNRFLQSSSVASLSLSCAFRG